MYAFGFQLFNQYCIKQLFYQTGRSTCTRSLPAGLYLSLFHNRSAGVRIPDISEHRVGLDLRSWTCSFVLSLRIRCTNCCAAIYNTGEYRIPVLLEPIFAAIFSFIFLHEKLTEMGYLGAIFILAGVFTAIDAKSTVMELITGKSVAEVTSKDSRKSVVLS